VLLYGQTRVFYTMSRDGLLPSQLALVHKRFRTPWVNTILVGIVAAGFAGFMGLDQLSDLTNVGSLTAFAIVCITVLYLRFSHPKMARPFRTPLFPLVPILGALMCLFLLMSLMATPLTRDFFLRYLAGGIVVYFCFGLWNSKLGKGLTVDGDPLPVMEAPHPGD
jgi:APA family basic amino acid/polyamine antiporter